MFDTFFSNQYYNFGQVGRYKYNKKLSLATRIIGKTAAEDVAIGERVVVKKDGSKITVTDAGKSGTSTMTFTYDASGNLTGITLPDPS